MENRGMRQFRVVAPVEKADDKGEVSTYWQRVGRAFENAGQEGKPASITVHFNALPLSGRVVLFEDDGRGRERQDEER